jgi:hypothetical protein
MQETLGTLELKIARLERFHHLLQQQRHMSQVYPDHAIKLANQDQQVVSQLNQLYRQRADFLIKTLFMDAA